MARFASGLSQLANRVLTISPLATGWHVAKSAARGGAAGIRYRQKKAVPSLLIGDARCAKNTDTANLATKGYCGYKATKGIKRHLLVDVLGTPYFVHCTKASLGDDEGFLTRIRENKQELLEWPVGQGVTRRLKHGEHKEQ